MKSEATSPSETEVNMKLGSIVGMIIAAVLTLAGITMCIIGVAGASKDGQELFMQIDESGTHYITEISSRTTKLSFDFEQADVVINGGADYSYIEFINFNPNKYVLSETANVITFSESADITSLLDIGDLTLSFKGLRYLLDVRNIGLDGLDKKIVINLANNTNLKMIDIDGVECTLNAEGITVAGDILLDADLANVKLHGCNISSTLGITANTLNANITDTSVGTLRTDAKDSEFFVEGTESDNWDITVSSGRIDCISDVTLDDKRISVSTQSGGLMINLKPTESPFTHEPSVEEDDEETLIKNFKITAESAVINLQFPTQLENSEAQNKD